MSHFTRLSLQIQDKELLSSIVQKQGLTATTGVATNPYNGQTVMDATIIKDSSGKTKLIIDNQTGNVIVDPYYMGYDYQKIVQEYAAEVIKKAAYDEGGFIADEQQTSKGTVIKVVIP
jgi:signal transduction protein with GAF and PtsI domain